MPDAAREVRCAVLPHGLGTGGVLLLCALQRYHGKGVRELGWHSGFPHAGGKGAQKHLWEDTARCWHAFSALTGAADAAASKQKGAAGCAAGMNGSRLPQRGMFENERKRHKERKVMPFEHFDAGYPHP